MAMVDNLYLHEKTSSRTGRKALTTSVRVVSRKTIQSKSRSKAFQSMIGKSVFEETIPLEARRCEKKSKVEGTAYGTQDNSST